MCFDDSLRLHSHQSLLLQYTESKFPGVSYFVNKKWVRICVLERADWPESITRWDIFFAVEKYVEREFMLKLVKLKDQISCGIYRDHIRKHKLFKGKIGPSVGYTNFMQQSPL